MAVIAIIVTAVTHKTNANPSLIDVVTLAQYRGLSNPAAIASSSVTYLVAGSASTTMVVGIDRADQAELNIYHVGSTTASVLLFSIDFSDDYNCASASNTCNWYREDLNSSSGSLVTHVAAPVFHTWSPALAATSTKNIIVNSLAARFMRVQFAASAAAGANSEIWVQAAMKRQNPSY